LLHAGDDAPVGILLDVGAGRKKMAAEMDRNA